MRAIGKMICMLAGIGVSAVLMLMDADDRAKADAIAVKSGFSSAADQRKARDAGITSPSVWRVEAENREKLRKADDREQEMRISACVRAERAVKQQLKAPATATFPDCGRYEVRATPDRSTYFVKGYVDAQNSFGAALRSTFAVKLKHEGSKQWTVMAAVVD